MALLILMYQNQYQGGLRMKKIRKILSLMIVLSMVVLIGTTGVGAVEESAVEVVETNVLEVESSPEDIGLASTTVNYPSFSCYADPSYESYNMAIPEGNRGRISCSIMSTTSRVGGRIHLRKRVNGVWVSQGYYIIPGYSVPIDISFDNLSEGTYQFLIMSSNENIPYSANVTNVKAVYY